MAGKPHGWALDLAGSATVDRDTSVVFSGSSSLKYSNPDNATGDGWHGISTEDPVLGAFCVPLRTGLTYHLRPASRCSLSGLQYRIRILHNAAGTLVSEKRFSYKAANTWQTDVFSFTVPAGAEQYSKVFVEFNRNGLADAADFWFDGLRQLEMEEVQFNDAGDSGSSITIDWSKGPTQRVRISAATPTILFVNGRPGALYTLLAQQDGTGNREVGTWDPSIFWPADAAPSFSNGVDRMDVLQFECTAISVAQVAYYGRLVASDYTLNDVKAATGSFAVTSAQTVGTTIAVTGLGFQPKLLLVFSSGRDGASDATGNQDARLMFGAASSTSQRRCIGAHQVHNVATTDTSDGIRDDAIAVEVTSGAVTGRLDLQSFDADGFTLIIDDQFAGNHRFFFLAIGGTTFQAKVGHFAAATATGNQGVIDPGFRPTGLLLFGAGRTAINTAAGQMQLGMGLLRQGDSGFAWAGSSSNAVTTPTPESYGYSGEGYAHATVTSGGASVSVLNRRADSFSFDAGGFTLNWVEVSGAASLVGYIAVAGCRCAVTTVTTRTDTTGDITATLLKTSPRALLFLSQGKALSTQDALDDNFEWYIGAAAVPSVGGAPSQVAAGVTDKFQSGVSNSVVGTSHAFDACYVNINQAGTLEGRMKVLSVEPNGFTCRMDDADPAAARVGVFAIGV